MKRALCWLRRDLRLGDNTALATATREASEVAVVFVFDANILGLLPRDDTRVTFIHRSVQELDRKLRAAGSRLHVLVGDPVLEVPRAADRLGADVVFAARDFEPYAIDRDRGVAEKVELRQVVDHVIQPGSSIATRQGAPFQVFTPYARAWMSASSPAMFEERVADLARLSREPPEAMPSLQELGFDGSKPWLEPGEDAGARLLSGFGGRAADYGATRDYPAQEGTSGLSAHLRFGTVSIRQAFRLGFETKADPWVNELIWREFYSMVLACFPHVATEPFQRRYREMDWPGTRDDFEAWRDGQTGFPIVDAAMRCLNQTGWMHNRLRMIVASFLTKDLLSDYRWGEAHFAAKLLDFDLASNNGGWQWAASTGTDAQPYFRVFNPRLQSEKFDPQGTFIRRWCPELAAFDDRRIHAPHEASISEQLMASCEIGRDYPAPIVDHGLQRDRAIQLFSANRAAEP